MNRSYSLPMGVHDIEPEEHSDTGVNNDAFLDNRSGRHVQFSWADYWSITADSVAREVALDRQPQDMVRELFSGYPIGAQTGWSAEDCWNDIFSGTLETFQIQHARQKRPWDVEERRKCLQLTTARASLSRDSIK